MSAYTKLLNDLHRGNIHERACGIILEDGYHDGGHHKQWVLDQVLRVLAGDRYGELIDIFEGDGDYEWDTGIAP